MNALLSIALTLIGGLSSLMLSIIWITPTTPSLFALLIQLFLITVVCACGLGVYALYEHSVSSRITRVKHDYKGRK